MTADRLHRTARKPHGRDSGRVPRSIPISLALFHCLSRAMPRRYRLRHGNALLELMTLVTEAEYRRTGMRGVLSATCRASLDLIDPADRPTLIVGPLLLATIGLVAASLAARRVLRADAAATLRAE